MLGFELAMLKARGKIDSSAGKDFLEAEGLLCPGEWQALIDGDRHTTVFWWIQVRSKPRLLCTKGLHHSLFVVDV